MNNGTDRDVALDILSEAQSINNSLAVVFGNLYAPVITTQPTDQTVAVGSRCEFTVEALMVASYQWQVKLTESGDWRDSSFTGNNKKTMYFNTTSAQYNYWYRCKLTGAGGKVVYTDVVQVILPAGG